MTSSTAGLFVWLLTLHYSLLRTAQLLKLLSLPMKDGATEHHRMDTKVDITVVCK